MTDAKNALKKKARGNLSPERKRVDTARGVLMAMKGEIENALPAYMPVDKFVRTALTAINTTPKLLNCTRESLLAAIMNSAQLGLEFNTPLGESYLIPYKNKVNFQIGYQGLLKLAYNTGAFKRITAREVRENEKFHINYGTGEIDHEPCLSGDSGDVIGYYATYQTKDGGQDVFYMSKEDAYKYGQTYSKTFNDGPWQTNFDAMAKKSALIQVLKYAPKATESQSLVQATSYDGTSMNKYNKTNDGSITFDVDYEVEAEEVSSNEKDIPDNVDKETGEIKDKTEVAQDDFFGDDFKPVEG